MDQGRNFDSDPAGDRNFCRQLCMWEENGESTRRRESQGVMKITPIPTATPTPVPRRVNKDAVAQSGSVTMVNEYLVQKEEGKAAGSSKAALQKSRLLKIRLTAAVMLLEIQQMKKLRPVVEINFTETAL